MMSRQLLQREPKVQNSSFVIGVTKESKSRSMKSFGGKTTRIKPTGTKHTVFDDRRKMCAAPPTVTATNAVIAEEVVTIHWQIEQCLVMSFDKPSAIALVTEAVFLRGRLPKATAFFLVQLGKLQARTHVQKTTANTNLLAVWQQLALQNPLWFAWYRPRNTVHNTLPLTYKFSKQGFLQRWTPFQAEIY